ncbi:MAG TPA: DUF1015 domain-containing protein [Bryobacteraceae bacterium]|nr:DUF1015 domain-containing protein [Bryobacteraceae bacterium]
MAVIKPFQAYRYASKAGDPARLLTQPYDKISPAMQANYLAASPYNLVRVILGERLPSDNDSDNVYTRAARYFHDWIRAGILAQDPLPAFYAYSQDFQIPDTAERASRNGFIGIGKLEDYSAQVVFPHEHTLSGPKKDRLELLRHTRAHFGQIFMLYPDPDGDVEKVIEEGKLLAGSSPSLDVCDDYQARHRLWPLSHPSTLALIQELMADKKLLIADGHHRYETALAFRKENPGVPAAEYVMITCVNLHSPGLRILATHRALRNLEGFDAADFLRKAAQSWRVAKLSAPAELFAALRLPTPRRLRIGVVTREGVHLLERDRKQDDLDVSVLHREILSGLLGIGEQAVRDEKYIAYLRGMQPAAAEVLEKDAHIAFLLEPAKIEDMARIAFSGGVMPQKSTDFYPKLLSGVTIYRL